MSIDRVVSEALSAERGDLERTTRDILKFVPAGTYGHTEVESRIAYVLDAIGAYELRIHWLKSELAATRTRYRYALVIVALCAWLAIAAAFGRQVFGYLMGA